MVKSNQPPQSGSSLEAVESNPKRDHKVFKVFFIWKTLTIDGNEIIKYEISLDNKLSKKCLSQRLVFV